MLQNRFPQPQLPSGQYIEAIPEKIDTAAEFTPDLLKMKMQQKIKMNIFISKKMNIQQFSNNEKQEKRKKIILFHLFVKNRPRITFLKPPWNNKE